MYVCVMCVVVRVCVKCVFVFCVYVYVCVRVMYVYVFGTVITSNCSLMIRIKSTCDKPLHQTGLPDSLSTYSQGEGTQDIIWKHSLNERI